MAKAADAEQASRRRAAESTVASAEAVAETGDPGRREGDSEAISTATGGDYTVHARLPRQ